MSDFNVVIIKDDELGVTDFIPLRKQNIDDNSKGEINNEK